MDQTSVDREVAEADLTTLLTEWGVELESSLESEAFEAKYERVLKTLTRGISVIEGDTIEYTVQKGELKGHTLTFKTPGMETLRGADGTSENDSVRRVIRTVAKWTGTSEKQVRRLVGPDFQFTQALFVIFFGQ